MSCDDGLFCNGLETCDVVVGCESGVVPSVDDGVGCTDDACDEATDTITHLPQDSLCDDATFCNGQETCDALLGCQSGTVPAIDDGVACTTDLCDEALNVVTHLPVDSQFDDGLFCNGDEICDQAQGCQTGPPPPLDDGVACTQDSCDEVADAVLHAPLDSACDDGLFCNGAETCDLLLDCQSGSPPEADDGLSCTEDVCDEGADAVIHSPDDSVCDDSDACTVGVCDAVGGCIQVPVPGCVPLVPVAGPGVLLGLAGLLLGSGLWSMRRIG